MTKKEFLNKLEKNLKSLKKKDIEEILSYYEEHFRIGLEKGKTEEKIAEGLGDVIQIANQFKNESGIEPSNKKEKSVILKIFLAAGLIFFNLVFVSGIFFGLLGALIGFFSGSLGMTFGGIAGLLSVIFSPIINIFIPVFIDSIPTLIFASIGVTCMGLLWFIGNCFIAKYLIKIVVFYGSFVK
jgi:uncharacterized membrane protein